MISRLMGVGEALDQAVLLDAEGKELTRMVLFEGTPVPEPVDGETVKVRPVSRVFRTTDFGYRTVTVERLLRLRFQMTPERLQEYEGKLREKLDGNGRGLKRVRSVEAQGRPSVRWMGCWMTRKPCSRRWGRSRRQLEHSVAAHRGDSGSPDEHSEV